MGLVIIVLITAPVWLYTFYLFVLTIASLLPARRPPPPRDLRFVFVVPAHNEASGIEATVTSLKPLADVWVVADNCADDTAALARAAGANVLERFNDEKKAKGYALEHAFNHFFAMPAPPDVAVVVDADSTVSSNLLTSMAARFAAGADAVQADYAVANPNASWRTRLMVIALSMFHILRSLGRERLGVSCGLRGNGMAFRLDLLKRVPYSAYSLVEDLEYGIILGRAGIRVHYAEDAHVYGEMVSTEKASRSQRERWERGRRELSRQLTWRALLAKPSLLSLDLALDLKCPPLSQLALLTIGTSLLCAFTPTPWLALPAPLFLALYVARGWQLSHTGARGLVDLALAPLYIAWKLTLALRKKSRGWVRTEREKR